MKAGLAKLIIVGLLFCQNGYPNDSDSTVTKQIRISIELFPGYYLQKFTLNLTPFDEVLVGDNEHSFKEEQIVNGRGLNWSLHFEKPKRISINPILRTGYFIDYILEPGDSILIKMHKNSPPIFSGTGSHKFFLIGRLHNIYDSLTNIRYSKRLSGSKRPLYSLEDYFEWSKFCDEALFVLLSTLEISRSQISEFAYSYIKFGICYTLEKMRLIKFIQLRETKTNDDLSNKFGLLNEDVCAIYDSTLNGTSANWLRYEAPIVFKPYYLWYRLVTDPYREKGTFIKDNETDTAIALWKDDEEKFMLVHSLAKTKYKGHIREEIMTFNFYDRSGGAFSEVGFTPLIDSILRDYYSMEGFSAYKEMLKAQEIKARERKGAFLSQNFSLTDIFGQQFTSSNVKGKIVVFDFWFTGCTGCVQLTPSLRKIEEEFKSDTNIVFVSVSIDKNMELWKKSVSEGKYTTGNGINVYTEGMGSEHPMIKDLAIYSYPQIVILNSIGGLVDYDRKSMDPQRDGGNFLKGFINRLLALSKDGPYIFHSDKSSIAFSINGIFADSLKMNRDELRKIRVQTDTRDTFQFILKKKLKEEPAEFSKATKLMVVSDIEGNFEAFRKLLQTNKVIDHNFNWIFGNGHLVFAGDMFDRGNQVTECLWLIYSLEEKAKASGGMVHFILGNHEIMNLQGNHKYVQPKYRKSAALMSKKLNDLYSEDSELGRWLRTKNIMEKIGDILFIHGGISRELNNLGLSIEEINKLAKRNYNEYKNDYGNEKVNTVMSRSISPFWFRGYYQGKQPESVIDSALQKFGANRIVTGHTIVADTISLHFGGKVINTDTKHAEGKSEALLIEGDRFYRVNAVGKRVLLFVDDKRKKAI